MKLVTLLFVLFFSVLNVFAQIEKPIFIINHGDTLFGTALLPKQNALVGVLIVAGSGPTDRDGLNPLGVRFPAYKLLAEGLTEQGLLTIRYDKRGIGESARAYDQSLSPSMDLYVNDVVSVLQSIKKEFPNIQKWVLIGHSEGALLGAAALMKEKVDLYISLAGTCESLLNIIEKQLKAQFPVNRHALFTVPIDSLKAGYTVTNYPLQLKSVFDTSIQPYLISSEKFAAKQILPQLNMPILIINGDNDIQIKVEDAHCLQAAQPKASLAIISNMNHILKFYDGTAAGAVAHYANPSGKIHPDLIPAIMNFIRTNQ